MAAIKIPADNITITEIGEVTAFLAARGIDYQRWTPKDSVDAEAPAEAVLAAYGHEIEALKAQGGYRTADVIDVRRDACRESPVRAVRRWTFALCRPCSSERRERGAHTPPPSTRAESASRR